MQCMRVDGVQLPVRTFFAGSNPACAREHNIGLKAAGNGNAGVRKRSLSKKTIIPLRRKALLCCNATPALPERGCRSTCEQTKRDSFRLRTRLLKRSAACNAGGIIVAFIITLGGITYYEKDHYQ